VIRVGNLKTLSCGDAISALLWSLLEYT